MPLTQCLNRHQRNPLLAAISDMTATIAAPANFQHAYQNQQMYVGLQMGAYMARHLRTCVTSA